MTIDYSALLYDPVYAELGVEATLTAIGTAGEVAITVIDDTRPKSITSGSAEVRSVGPGAYARIPELAENGVEREDYLGALLEFNGRAWVVRSYELRGSPNGEDVGEVRFFLKVAESISSGLSIGTAAGVGSAAAVGIDSSAALPVGVTLQDIDGGPTYYADNGFAYAAGMGWDDPDFFPIGVWNDGMTSDANRDALLDLGINTMVGLGPSFMDANVFTRLAGSGLSFVATNDEQAEALMASGATYWVGNITQDEAQTFAAGASDYISTLSNARQDGRWWYYNGNWFFFHPLAGSGGGLDPYEADVALSTTVATPNATLRHLDLASIDIYLFAGAKASTPVGFTLAWATTPLYGRTTNFTADEGARGSHYGDMVDSMRLTQAANYPAPIGAFIENGGPYSENTTGASYISPAEMNAAIWGTIIHGARWFSYFNHTFGGPAADPDISSDNFELAYFQTIQAGETISIYDQAKATNALVASLATVINSPFAVGYATVSPPAVRVSNTVADSGFDLMAKYHNVVGGDDKFYLFAMPRYSRSTTNQNATFTIANTGATQVTVINEARTISVTGGSTFTDTFATGNTVHIYRVD